MIKKSIEFVYFDVGGVLIVDFSGNDGWQSLLDYWGITPKNRSQFDAVWQRYHNRLCVEPDVVEKISRELRMIPGFRAERLDFVQNFVDRFEVNLQIERVLKKLDELGMPYGMLTDMYPGMLAAISTANLLPRGNFQPIIDSSVVGAQKSSGEIFPIAQDGIKFPKDRVLYVDNAKDKITIGKKYGWQTFWYDTINVSTATKDLEKLLFD